MDFLDDSFQQHDQINVSSLRSNICSHHLFERQVQQTPNAIALEYFVRDNSFSLSSTLISRSTLSYDELNIQANSTALILSRMGIGPEVLVGIFVNEGPSMVISQLAVWKAGGAFIPCDLYYPAHYTRFVVQDAQPAILIARSDQVSQIKNALNGFETKEISKKLDNGSFLLSKEPTTIITIGKQRDCDLVCMKTRYYDSIKKKKIHSSNNEKLSSRNLCHAIYTSGSTGQRKGVLCEHRNLVNFLVHKAKIDKIASQSRVFLATAFTFDPSIGDTFSTLSFGGTLCMSPRELVVQELALCLRASRATHVWVTPSLWSLLDAKPDELPHLKTVGIGGEKMKYSTIAEWAPAVRLLNCYGVTEMAVYQTVHDFTANASNWNCNCIGRPMHGIELYILDNHFQPVTVGAVGEIFMGGVQVARGYLNRPDLTKERFMTLEVFGKSKRFFRTGDLAKYESNAQILLIGRADFQVKINGLRVELGEIENVLRKCCLVGECTVVMKKCRLIAYIIFSSSSFCSNDVEKNSQTHVSDIVECTLRLHCKKYLPQHMIPGLFIQIHSFPLTMSGKINRAALIVPKIMISNIELNSPLTNKCKTIVKLQKVIGQVWENVLGVNIMFQNTYDTQNDFIRNGGDSLAALRVVKILRDILFFPKEKEQVDDFGRVHGVLSPENLFKRPILISYTEYLHRQGFRSKDSMGRNNQARAKECETEYNFNDEGETNEAEKAKIKRRITKERIKDDEEDIDQNYSIYEKTPYNVLLRASQMGHITVVQALLEANANPNPKGKNLIGRRHSFAPLHAAASNGQTSLVNLLIQHGACVNVTTSSCVSASHYAAIKSAECLAILLSNGAISTIRDANKQTLWHWAARAGNCDSLKLLINDPKCSSHVNTRDRWQRTSIHWAVLNNHLLAIKLLVIQAGAMADPPLARPKAHMRITHATQETPIEIAHRLYGEGEILIFLRKNSKHDSESKIKNRIHTAETVTEKKNNQKRQQLRQQSQLQTHSSRQQSRQQLHQS